MIPNDGSLWLLLPMTGSAVFALWVAVKLDERKHGPAPLLDPTDSIIYTIKLLLPRKPRK